MANKCVTMWKCYCGVRIKAVTEWDQDPTKTVTVVCKCGKQRVISGNLLVSVTQEPTDAFGIGE